MKNSLKEIQSTVETFKNRLDQAEERISELSTLLNQSAKNKEQRIKRNEQSLQEIWDYIKQTNTKSQASLTVKKKMQKRLQKPI